jgi:CRISPR-associated endonuclease/helicase Cas3
MNRLRSHPDIWLKDHVEQVDLALEGLRRWHSPPVLTSEVQELAKKLGLFHDLGKASQAFQKYILAPDSYSGDRLEKSHSPLSALLTLLLCQNQEVEPLSALLLAACVAGHHGSLPHLPSVKMSAAFHDTKDKFLDDFSSSELARVLTRQLASLDRNALTQETGLDLTGLDLAAVAVRSAKDYLRHELLPKFYTLSPEGLMDFRLKAQLIFSMLLEADKAFLAVPHPDVHLARQPRYWQASWIEKRLGQPKATAVNLLRQRARNEVVARAKACPDVGLFSLTAPTGLGKTLLAATWALRRRDTLQSTNGIPPKIIVVLPYLSILDQTAQEYRAILQAGEQELDGSWFLTSHSLSDRRYAPWLEEKAETFFVDTWRTEMVITTYDQFLMSLLDARARYQMRFHNLCDALIILDEVQSLPCRLWRLLSAALQSLVKIGGTQVLLMSATLPPFVKGAEPLLANFSEYFQAFSRYQVKLNLRQTTPLADFCREMGRRLPDWLKGRKRVLITLNTRRSAGMVYDYLRGCWPMEYSDTERFFLSADVTPKDRLEKIGLIRQNRPCLVVSTQCLEAGVDLDMSLVIRDFAPWDSLVQIAGRCNREGKRGRWLPVEIVDLVSDKGRRFSEMIYDEVALQVTRNLLDGRQVIREEEVLEISASYFHELDLRKDTGQVHLDRFACWQPDLSVRELLRGRELEKYTFLVQEQDPGLKTAMLEAHKREDRWDRREAWRRLAGRLAAISVELYARPDFRAEDIATEFLGHWLLKEGYYDPDRGLSVDKDAEIANGPVVVF